MGAGINLEYFFSSVDNEVYGCGTKLPHNVTGLLGVMNGHQGDLRTGLPLQMVELHDESGTLEIMADSGTAGHLTFTGGRIVDAACGEEAGEAAAYALLAVQKGYFRMQYGQVAPDPAAPAIGAILFEHMRRADESGEREAAR